MPDARQTDCDILLLLEGTYPYIKGGVSSWVHELMSNLPHWRFSAVFIGSQSEDYGDIQYHLPDNLCALQTYYLFDDKASVKPKVPRGLPPDSEACYARLHDALRTGKADLLDAIIGHTDPSDPFSEQAFLYGEPAWRYITASYEARATEPSFVDYFWTVRNLHGPLWKLTRISDKLPSARLLFSPSTGYAGLLGVLSSHSQQRPLVLMEHGIYTKERRIDLMNATWISDTRNPLQHNPTEVSHLRQMWIEFFETLGRMAYRHANPIISLFEAARQQQIRDGADPERTRIIPNGVDIKRLAALRRPIGTPPPNIVCLLGRVVPIKDIKTFIRAAHALRQRIPEVQAWIVGPEDEDPEYSLECHELVQALNLGKHLHFLGFQNIVDILPKVGVLVLSSISEGLPLSILEGFAAGLPCVTTDVGACSELIYGREDADRALGTAGAVVRLADHEALAAACASLLQERDAYARAAQTAIRRVETYYDQTHMIATFDRLFAEHITPGKPI